MSFFYSILKFWYRQIFGFHILDHVGVFFTIPVFFFHRWIVQSKSNQRIARTERVCPRDLCCAHARKSVWIKKRKRYKTFFCMSVYCSYSEFFFSNTLATFLNPNYPRVSKQTKIERSKRAGNHTTISNT